MPSAPASQRLAQAQAEPVLVARPAPQPPGLPPEDASLGAPAWGRGRVAWTRAVRTVAYARIRDFERASDKETFCPGYSQAAPAQRLNCWVLILAAVSKFESGFNAGSSFREPDGSYSVGLLALSPRECPNAPTVRALMNPVANLVCGANRMAALIARDGYLDGPEPRRGAASYWSTLRAPYRRWDPTRNRTLNLGKKDQILPLTRGYR